MVDLSITAANVRRTGGASPMQVRAGATITRGQAVYLNTSTGLYEVADADLTGTAEVAGIALTDGNANGDMLIAGPGTVVNIGATTIAGTIYVLSTTGGGIAPWADLITGDFVCVLFIGTGSATVELIIKRSSVARA